MSARQIGRYVALIADGNGRWAYARGLPANEGHRAGADTLKARLCDAAELGVRELTVYFFSTENWTRPAGEVKGLLELLGRRIATETSDLRARGIRLRFIGRRESIDQRLLEHMRWAERLTARSRRMTLYVAFNYGGRAEILDAAEHFTGSTEEEFRSYLYAPDMHDPELIIRTGGEQRLSNYLLWQAAYAKLVFREELWPDFTRQALEEALYEHSP
jgi:undecaprenyl diphosphate synthase